MSENPVLRPIDFQPVQHQGEPMWLLRDPLQLSPRQLLVPPALAQVLIFCDGSRDLPEIHRAVSDHLGFPIPYDTVAHLLTQLDESFLLDNRRSRHAKKDLLAAFRAQPARPPAIAGLSYAADPVILRNELTEYGFGDDLSGWSHEAAAGTRAIISPHIDYMRGGPVYARTWARAKAAVADADLVVMFGTDHNGGLGSLTLTRLPYATPFGVIPTDTELVDKLAHSIGEDAAYALELNHQQEHAIELSAVWLHHIAGDNPPPMVPVLCGSFHHFVTRGGHPESDPTLEAFLETLQRETAGRRVLAVASVDFAHVGPNFGDEFAMDGPRREQLRRQDASLMEAISQGDATRFYNEIAAVEDQNRICGFSSIYLLLRYLDITKGVTIAYDHCA
ncbi:MAG: AmmeMemoRadiSam system protein B, partial [Anaerolineales bacterium]|nr:AmmeMemoRadiSam system protein B [Anaerolineales bacterium]